MAALTDDKLRLRFVHNFDVLPIKIRLCDANVHELKSRIRPFLEEKCGKKIELSSLSLLHCERPLRDVDGCALRGVRDQALIECIVAAPDEAAAAGAQAAQAEACLLARVEEVNSDVDTLQHQARAGSFEGKPKVLLEALERRLYSLDKIRAAAGEKLSPQVMSARKAATRRINDLHSTVERQGGISTPLQLPPSPTAAPATSGARGSSTPQQPVALVPQGAAQSNGSFPTQQ